jgi:M6 family metalloprotease-like protein
MQHVSGAQKYAVLLCGLNSAVAAQRRSKSFFEDLFANDSPDGLSRYWRDASHGAISLAGTQVFGWRELPQALAAEIRAAARPDRRRLAAEHFATDSDPTKVVDFTNFDGIVVVTDEDVDLGGSRTRQRLTLNGVERDYRALICNQTHSHAQIAHELGHSLGLDHAFTMSPKSCSQMNDGRPGAYCDFWDIMGASSPSGAPSPRFGATGPLVNTAEMRLLGWLPETRVRRPVSNSDSFQLRPLSRPDLPGDLAVDFDGLLVEFRMNEGWDAGLGSPGVLIHRIADEFGSRIPDDQHSVLLGYPTTEFLEEGDTYGEGDATFGPYRQVTVTDIDAANRTATVSCFHKPRVEKQELGILQWIVEGVFAVSPTGRVVIVPPRPPIRELLAAIAVNEIAESLSDGEAKEVLAQASLDAIETVVKRERRL